MSYNVKGYNSPAVSFEEGELVRQSQLPNVISYGIVGLADKGPSILTEITSVDQLHRTFGYSLLRDGTVSYGIIAAERQLKYCDRILFKRIINTTEDKEEGITIVDVTLGETAKDTVIVKLKNLNRAITRIETVREKDPIGSKITYSVYENSLGVESLVEEGTFFIGTEANKASYDNPEKVFGFSNYLELVSNTWRVTGEAIDVDKDIKVENEVDVEVGVYYTAEDKLDVVKRCINVFANEDNVDISVISCPDSVNMDCIVDANRDIITMCEQRGDCFALLDYPNNLAYTAVAAFFNGETEGTFKVDFSGCGVVYPWTTVSEAYLKKNIDLPSSVILGTQIAYTDATKFPWYAPAGFGDNRGVIADAVSVKVDLTKDERDYLYENCINPVMKFVGTGIVIFGNKTMKRSSRYEQESVYCSLNVRRMVHYIRKLVIKSALKILLNPNDSLTWEQFKADVEPKIRSIQTNRGIERYKIVMDRTTISDDDIANGKAPAVIMIMPIKALEFIPIKFTATMESIVFGEEE